MSRRATAAPADRDRILEQALTHQLAGDMPPATEACLDAETLAAWEEGGLEPAAMASAEVHISSCGHCQAILAAMAHGTPPVVAAAERQGGRWWSWWLAPIAAATAAVMIWIVVPEQQRLATAPPSAGSAAREIVGSAKPDAGVANKAKAIEASAEPRDTLKDRAAQLPVAPLAEREDRREQQPLSADQAVAPSKEESGRLAAREKLAPGAEAVPAEAVAAAGSTLQDRAAPLATAAPAAAPPAAPAVGALQKSARANSGMVEVIAPDSVRRWRIVPTGVEYSVDRGISWVPVRAVGTEVLTGGTAPAGSICWLIGRAGVVLVTVDGMTFAKVDLPERVDVMSITATDARSASVIVADGRTFHTDDSGRNWRQN